MANLYCSSCNKYFESFPYGKSYYVLCPDCCKVVTTDGNRNPSFPLLFYLGYRTVAKISREGNYPNYKYFLQMDGNENIELKNKAGFDEMLHDSLVIVKKWLLGE